LHRLIMLSAVYQQAGDGAAQPGKSHTSPTPVLRARFESSAAASSASALQIDPENRLLWHMTRQRLDFESLHDSLLFISGQLDSNMGGKPEELFKPPFSKRRSVYGFIDRQFLPGALRSFDFANPDMHNPQRSETTIPQQALFFMNSPFVVEQARALAARVGAKEQAGSTTGKVAEERIKHLHRLVYQREPAARQLKRALEFVTLASAEKQDDQGKPASAWSYGYGELEERTNRVKMFQPLPFFNGDAWQGGKTWPDEKLGWAQLTATGGHAGNDRSHVVIRRWTAPIDGAVAAEGLVKHQHPEGDGIRAFIISSRQGLLGHWVLHNQSGEAKVDSVEVKKGDTIDFVVSINESLNSNDFMWSPLIRMTGPDAVRDANGYARQWSATREFSGPPGEEPKPLTPWEQYAQVLLLSNEFLFVD